MIYHKNIKQHNCCQHW